MGQAATELDNFPERTVEAPSPARPPAASRPVLTVVQPREDVSTITSLIGRASTLLAGERERAEAVARQAADVEARLREAERRAADLAIKLEVALAEAAADKERAQEAQRRFGHTVEKMRALLVQAGDRLLTAEARAQAAEQRAEKAEGSFTTVRLAVEKQFAPLFV